MRLAGALLTVALGALAAAWLRQEQAAEEAFWASEPRPLPGWTLPISDGALDRFSQAIKFRTVGNGTAANHVSDTAPFEDMHSWMKISFPSVWKHLRSETVNSWSLIFKWEGSDAGLKPGLLMSHMDVVPVEKEDADRGKDLGWSHAPFGGSVAEGFVWGRGTMDVKFSLISILEAVEGLLGTGFQPHRTLYLAFGHDEEVGGTFGAKAIVQHLKGKGVAELEFVLDEGGCVMTDGFSSLTKTAVAVVGTAEKVGSIMGRVLTRLDKAPINPSMIRPTSDMLKALAPVAPLYLRPLLRMADNTLIGFLLAQVVGAASAEGAALTRTTVTPTFVSAGVAHNVMPQAGQVFFNSRIMPGETPADVLHYINVTAVSSDAAFVDLSLAEKTWDPSPVSDYRSDTFAIIKQAILEVLPKAEREMVVAPYLVTGATDSRHYLELTSQVFRFVPLMISKKAGDIGRFHSRNERAGVDDYLNAVRFYKHFISLSVGKQ